MTLKVKLILFSAAALIILIYIAWYTFNYIHYRKNAVLTLASQSFSCPREQIHVGSSYQYNDGPAEIPVTGCGREGLVLCFDATYKQGMWGQYFSFDLECRFGTTTRPQ